MSILSSDYLFIRRIDKLLARFAAIVPLAQCKVLCRQAGIKQQSTGLLHLDGSNLAQPIPKQKDHPFGWSFCFGAASQI